MVNITDKDGVFVLEGDEFDLKIDNNRKIYVKRKGDSNFESIGTDIPVGYYGEEKKRYLYNLYQALKDRSSEINSQEQ